MFVEAQKNVDFYKSTKIMLVEDHTMTRQGLCIFCNSESSLQVVAEAIDAQQALIYLNKSDHVDLVIIDYQLPGNLDGVGLTKKIRRLNVRIKILFHSAWGKEIHVRKALNAGADGYILKESTNKEIKYAIQEVLAGRKYKPSIRDDFFKMTPSEEKVCQELPENKTCKQIAEKLGAKSRTIEKHISNLFKKLIENSGDLVNGCFNKRANLIIETYKRFSEPERIDRLYYRVPDGLSLEESLKQYIERSREKEKIPLDFNSHGNSKKLSDAVKNTLYSIGREVLSSIDRDGRSTHIAMQLQFNTHRNHVVLEISAKSVEASLIDEHMDIEGIKKRAQKESGDFQIMCSIERIIFKVFLPQKNHCPKF